MLQDILPRLIAQMARGAALCVRCGAVGTTYNDDHTTLICGRCWLLAHGKVPNDV